MKEQIVNKRIIIAGLCVLALSAAAFAEGKKDNGKADPAAAFPKRSIQFIVPANAGGATDLGARVIAKYLTEEFKQPTVIVNMAGASGTIASRKVMDSDADGYTALYFHQGMLIAKLMGVADFSYEAFKCAGIVLHDNTNSFYVNTKSDVKTLGDLVAKAKATPESITYATETGSFTHLQGLAFQKATGVKFNIVDVGTDSQKIAALKGNKVDVIPNLYSTAKQYVDSGDFRLLGFFSEQRNALNPDIQTAKEQGVNFSFDGYYFGLFFPKNTPDSIIAKVSAALKKVAENPAFLQEAKKLNFEVKYLDPAQSVDHIKKIAESYDSFKGDIKK